MNFFKSVFSDDPDPPEPPKRDIQLPTNPDDNHHPGSDPDNPSKAWTFGGLIKTLQSKSDWIETYRRDLEEFGSGLKQETQIFREVASKAVKELPTSIDSIGSSVFKSTAEIMSSFDDDVDNNGKSCNLGNEKYSRFDAQLRALQCDVNTYVQEPDDFDDFEKWKLGFDLGEKRGEIEGLMSENGNICDVYKRVVNNIVDHDVFWLRYYYRVYKFMQAENVRAKLVKRASVSIEDAEEELSWDVDDDEEAVRVKVVSDNVEYNEKSNVVGSSNEGVSSREVVCEGVTDASNDQFLQKSEGCKSSNEGVSCRETVCEGITGGSNDQFSKKSEGCESSDEGVSSREMVCEGITDASNDQFLQKSEGCKSSNEGVSCRETVCEGITGGSNDQFSKKSEGCESSDEGVSSREMVCEGITDASNDQFSKKSEGCKLSNEGVSSREMVCEGNTGVSNDQFSKKSEGKVVCEGKSEHCESGKESDVSVVSSVVHSTEEDDMGWDEIEDVGSGDEKKVSHSEVSNRDELRKRLSAADEDEDEDLSWDIGDDD